MRREDICMCQIFIFSDLYRYLGVIKVMLWINPTTLPALKLCTLHTKAVKVFNNAARVSMSGCGRERVAQSSDIKHFNVSVYKKLDFGNVILSCNQTWIDLFSFVKRFRIKVAAGCFKFTFHSSQGDRSTAFIKPLKN